MQISRQLFTACALVVVATSAFAAGSSQKEDYVRAPMPPGFQVTISEIEGPVFADAKGRTLYNWPTQTLRNGNAGEIPNKPTCTDQRYKVNSGLMSPYPAGLELPEVATRPSCTDVWPPVLAAVDAKPVGKWTIVDRLDGRKQWAYNGMALYTSVLDKRAGDVLGGSNMFYAPEVGAQRFPVQPDPNVPSHFIVTSTMMGRVVTLKDGWAIYTSDRDARHKSNCDADCLLEWTPIEAPAYARPVGEWTVFERAPGVRQWAFRGKPVYRHPTDSKTLSQDGSDVAGWHNVYTQQAPMPPSDFTLRENFLGVVLADSKGNAVYRYHCADDAVDQLACDNPETPQVYRLAVCGGGDWQRCLKTFPYVIAPAGAKSGSQVWTTMYIDPKTGKRAAKGRADVLHVWAFRDRPIYTFAGDRRPGDMNAHSFGEFNGARNGFKVMAYRDVFGYRADSFPPFKR